MSPEGQITKYFLSIFFVLFSICFSRANIGVMYGYLQGQQHINIHNIYAGHCNTAFNVNKRHGFLFFPPMMSSQTKFTVFLLISWHKQICLHDSFAYIYIVFFSCTELRTIHVYTKTKLNITVIKTLVCVPRPMRSFPKEVKLNVRRFDFRSPNHSHLCKNRPSSLKRGIPNFAARRNWYALPRNYKRKP